MARNGKAKINPDDLAPGIAKGFTQGASAQEALQEFPASTAPSGVEIARNFSSAVKESEENPRAPRVHFIAEIDSKTIIHEPNTGRDMIDANVTLPPEHRRQIISGYRCINCYEGPFEVAWPEACDVCGFEVRDRQVLRAAHEFEGERHVGPSKPIREFLAEKDLAQEQRLFEQKLAGGRSRRRKGL